MKQGSYPIRLVGPSGDEEDWILVVEPIPHDRGHRVFGRVNWTERRIILNSRMRSKQIIDRTIAHEALHVTAGPNGSEHLTTAHEDNWDRIARKLAREEERD